MTMPHRVILAQSGRQVNSLSACGITKVQLRSCHAALDVRIQCILVLACIVCVITTIMNVTALRSLDSVARPEFLPSLEYPNSYTGLENADLYDPTPLPPIHNFPRLLAQINNSNPSLVYLDLHRWSSGFGMIYPSDRQFLVSSQARRLSQYLNIITECS